MLLRRAVCSGLFVSLLVTSTAQAQCETQVLFASDATAGDAFGYGADLEGDLLALGAIGQDVACPTNPLCQSGAVYMFRRTAGVWAEEAKLSHSDGAARDEFGHDIAISGNRVIIGAHKKGTGAAYVYTYDGATWGDERKLLGTGLLDNFHFGHSVGMDGDVAVIGTMRDNHAGFETGSAFVFRYMGGTWVEQAKLTGSNSALGDRFGRSSDLDGDYIAIGAHLHDGVGADSGSAYVFERDDNGTPGDFSDDTWPEVAALTPSDPEAGGYFGRSVDINGNIMIVGSSLSSTGGVQMGAAYIFFRGGGGWVQVQKLVPSDGVHESRFGISVSLDGNYAIIGASGDDDAGNNSGASYIFTRTPAGYFETGKLVGSSVGAEDQSGNETGVHVEGTTALYTARFNSVGGQFAGSAYIYELADCLGNNYCSTSPNSVGSGAVMHPAGLQSIGDNTFTLVSSGAIPNKVGLFFYGPNQIDVPLGDGRLCVGGVVRLNPPTVTDGAGVATRHVDFTTPPAGSGPSQITAGSTWNFQHWYRDPDFIGGTGFNLSDAVEVSFIP